MSRNSFEHHKFLESAEIIGDQICDQAFWSKSECNWIGRALEDKDGSLKPIRKNLGPTLYGGTSGIALFLFYLYGLINKERYYKTMIGSLNHSFLHLDHVSGYQRIGLYDGWVGIAFTAAIIGNGFDDSRLTDKSFNIIQTLHNNKNDKHYLDLISGNAGAIPALLYIYFNIERDNKILELTKFLGDELVSTAVKNSTGWSWGTNRTELGYVGNLTGFAHGAAGYGYALLELYYATDDEEYMKGAEEAFRYENSFFNNEYHNWRDLRVSDKMNETKGEYMGFATAWCHGAPGIGLSRLRAFQKVGNKYFDDCLEAIQTCSLLVEQKLGTYSELNYSLCHGLTGISETLMCASEILSNPSYKLPVFQMASRAIEKFIYNKQIWPCGIPNGETPELMLGLAGIGYFFLRLYDPKNVPSILMITPT